MKLRKFHIGLWLELGVGFLVVLLGFQLTNLYGFRIDMTEEKRYSISKPTKDLLRRLDQEVFIDVYLEGDLPANFTRFQTSIRELLDEFSVYSGTQFNFRFSDPAQASSARARNQFFQELIDSGLQPTSLNFTTDGQTTQKLLFPGAIISYGGREQAVNLLAGNRAASPEAIINQSIEGLEYKLASGIQQLAYPNTKRVGLITGHGEPDTLQLAALTNLVLSRYELFRINLPERTSPISGYDLLLVTKPTRPFTDREKFLLDQYIMKGGRVAFFVDALRVNMDSASGEGTVAVPYQTGLNDLLFRYGVRINQNYVVDLNCGDFPVVAGNVGDQPQIRMLPWPYFPVITNYGKHPVVKNLDASIVRFASTIDTVKAPGIRKTPIMMTSSNTKVMGAPITVSFNDLRSELLPEKFQSGPQTVGYLLEGSFTSLYKNKFPPKGLRDTGIHEDGIESKIVVVADGDLIRNELSLENGKPLPLGMEPYSQSNYANEALVTNLLDYMLDDAGLIEARTKELSIRLLDKVKVKKERLKWQLINLVLPMVVLILFGVIKVFLRNRRHKSSG